MMSYNNQKSIDDAIAAEVAAAVAPLNQRITEQDALIKTQADTILALSGDQPVPPDPNPTPEPSDLRGWELNETNTGLAGVGLTRADMQPYDGEWKPAAGTHIYRKLITLSSLNCMNGDITLEECCIAPTESSGSSSIIWGYDPEHPYDQRGPVTLINCDIDASAVTDPRIYKDCAFRGAANIRGCNMWGMGTGIALFNNGVMAEVLVERNYIHDLRGGMVNGDQSHNESATTRMALGSDHIWRDNRLISRTGSDSGSMFIQTIAGDINNLLIEGNELNSEGGYCMPLEAMNGHMYSNVRAVNNRFVRAVYGFAYVDGGPGWTEWSENYQLDAGQPDYKGESVSSPG
jgi:hypothetical protein